MVKECEDEDNFVKALTVSGCAAMPRFLKDSIPSLLMPNCCSVLDKATGNELNFRIYFWLSHFRNNQCNFEKPILKIWQNEAFFSSDSYSLVKR